MGYYVESPFSPFGLEYEAAGIIDALGEDMKGFEIKDEVSVIGAFFMAEHLLL